MGDIIILTKNKALTEDETMMNIQKAIDLGAKRWTKNGYDRLYINLEMVEAACEKYNEGVVPMNRRAKGNFKMWIEVETGEIKSQGAGLHPEDIEKWVMQYIEEV